CGKSTYPYYYSGRDYYNDGLDSW
nr:immunoglobulin heavy chain junction region [Macaca mulatta]MOW48178.1 immunoglobulin heavy chain junction region [Macaca mulatta]MOW49525.1 immunoglobulin heavy chain junction region [Macaca mulatta]